MHENNTPDNKNNAKPAVNGPGDFFEQYLAVEASPRAAGIKIPNERGVLLFCDRQNRPVQLLSAASLRRTAISRLEPSAPQETSPRDLRLHEIIRNLYFTVTFCEFNTLKVHELAARTFFEDPVEHVKLPGLNFVSIDLDDTWPNFRPGSRPGRNLKTTFGPFMNTPSARRFLENLREIFDLCKRPALVDHPQKAASCPYLQMDQCPAPCVGKTEKNQYLEKIHSAANAFPDEIENWKEYFTHRMETAAREMRFEDAQKCKKKLQAAEALLCREYEFTSRIENLLILHVDKSARVKVKGRRKKLQLFEAFLITQSGLRAIAPFSSEQSDQLLAELRAERNHAKPCTNADSTGQPQKNTCKADLAKSLQLASACMYKKHPAGIWQNLSHSPLPDKLSVESLNE